MNKTVRDGHVAVIITTAFNSNWYTNHEVPELLFDPVVVNMVEEMKKSDNPLEVALLIEKYCDERYGERTYYGDTMYLDVKWVPQGTAFNVEVIDNYETIIEQPVSKFLVA
jgi:hypothetical protein